jgi:hypothetical protein
MGATQALSKDSERRYPRVAMNLEQFESLVRLMDCPAQNCIFYRGKSYASVEELLRVARPPLAPIDIITPELDVNISASAVVVRYSPHSTSRMQSIENLIGLYQVPPVAAHGYIFRILLVVAFYSAAEQQDYHALILTLVVAALVEHLCAEVELQRPLIRWWPSGLRDSRFVYALALAGLIVGKVLANLLHFLK